jgi:hypothetical protein
MNIIDTLTSQTTSYVNELIKNIFLPRIVKYVNERDTDDLLTTDELSKVLSLPVLKLTQSHKNHSNSYSSKRCIWEFKRGKSRGDVCNKQTVEGSEYCSSCIKRVTFSRSSNNFEESNVNDTSLTSLPVSGGDEKAVLDAKFYDKERGLIKFNSYIMRIEQLDEEKIMYIIGKLDENDNLVKLSEIEYDNVIKDGYLIDEDFKL